jgi:hypothetical protein
LKAKKQKWMECIALNRGMDGKCGNDPMPRKSQSIPKTLWKHGFLSWQVCNPTARLCGKLKIQNGRISILAASTTSPADPSLYSLFPTVGLANKSSDREKRSYNVSYGRWGVGVGHEPNGVPNRDDWDVSIGTSIKGSWVGTENNGIKRWGASHSNTLWSQCFIGSCK